MAKFAGITLLDGGSDVLRTRAGTANRVKQLVIKAYAAGDSYATVSANKCGEIAMVAADIGVAGKDVLIEHGGEGLYAPLDLNIAKCRMMVAVPEGFDYANAVRQGARLRVASKYTKTAREHFASKGVHVDLIKLYGSMELAPLAGLADAIVDLVSTGGTLKANKLVAVEHIVDISSRLVVNQASLKVKRETLQPIIDAFAGAVEK